jgi:hypothetical protein
MAIYKQGECNDPLYLCAGHFAESGFPTPNSPEVRPAASAPPPAAVLPRPVVAHARPLVIEPAMAAVELAGAVVNPVVNEVAVAPIPPAIAPAVLSDRSPVNDASEAKPAVRASQPVAASKPTVARASRSAGGATSRTPVRDASFGDSAKALVDEAIWNLPAGDFEAYASALRAGKSATEAAQAAGGQLAFVHRKIGEYGFKMEMVLSESGAKISAAEVIEKPFELAALEIIGSEMPDNEKDEAIARLGALQQAVNGGVGREMTPLQAYRIARAIGDRAGWGLAQLPDQLKPVYRAVYSSVREAIRIAVPLASTLDERLANLYAAKAELEAAPAASGLQRLTA